MNHQPQESLKANILIVDDTPDNLRLLSTMLQSQGYQVRKALSGKFALQGVEMAKPDLILLDINMPQMSGYEVCQHLKSNPQTCEIPVIFLSALDQVSDKVEAFAVGGVDYITKPFQSEEVLARINNQLTLQNLQKQLKNQNIILQQEIEERKLAEARERAKAHQLEITLEELKRTQAHLIQSEKMSSLGQMVAGVAHEINNPVNFILGNLDPATEYAHNLIRLIKLYQKTYPDCPQEISQLIEEIELNFLIEDWPKLMKSMKVGSERIHQIVVSLRSFSRLDESNLKPVDIHDGIDNTLLILHHRLKCTSERPGIETIKDYGKLPNIVCYASQLNQVFMNLLSNAIDAVETQPFPRIITIRTSLSQNETSPSVIIRIADNGLGMSEEVCQHIFDPFFTTKPVGSGTGLGLSISYQIVVEKHGGKLTCVSQPGKGTEMIVEIPVKPY
ncbi:MAG TPA: hybrid sensor histidine kinase/response regulator [Cyanobacteria bacterium UBA11149]|nr:hybrid sensor histidine kinase/response regulator [Cyanobacteria bacterium UBA11367]HBE58919.1 hybrid sensor histidine kinase/response regulator [Cyanobacteria bacterium UBA11366]HBK63762.1 hybrid sensor histidine kinase/response regulator [Cyanobacteria bacterium UBA11166]HBR75651.1 hybrid sensor histidine kinase/response regulator [Cyanobacteria bacterium UBA11159]HBS70948.1 hybrid sensor histidine kinase/response regulator [Cyanobacteria bacterium UBA11153]HBW87425.1 hybrid sensor histid